MLPLIAVFKTQDDAIYPTRAYKDDSGWDLYAREEILLWPSQTRVIPTGIRLQLPSGFEAQVRPKSGLSSKGIFVILGTIDNQYAGEVGVTVYNGTKESFKIEKGMKIAQLVPTRLSIYEMDSDCTDGTKERGENGYGSSGV